MRTLEQFSLPVDGQPRYSPYQDVPLGGREDASTCYCMRATTLSVKLHRNQQRTRMRSGCGSSARMRCRSSSCRSVSAGPWPAEQSQATSR
jgi:hypothetical protein